MQGGRRVAVKFSRRVCAEGCAPKGVCRRVCAEGCVPKDVYRRVCAEGCAPKSFRGIFGQAEDSGGGESGGPDSSWNGCVCFTEGLREPNVAVYTEQAMRYLTLFWSFSFNNSRTLFLSSAITPKAAAVMVPEPLRFPASCDRREHLSYVLLQSVTGENFE